MNSSPPRNSCSIKAIQVQKADFNLSSPLFLWEHRVGKSLGINHLPHTPLIVFDEGSSGERPEQLRAGCGIQGMGMATVQGTTWGPREFPFLSGRRRMKPGTFAVLCLLNWEFLHKTWIASMVFLPGLPWFPLQD